MQIVFINYALEIYVLSGNYLVISYSFIVQLADIRVSARLMENLAILWTDQYTSGHIRDNKARINDLRTYRANPILLSDDENVVLLHANLVRT